MAFGTCVRIAAAATLILAFAPAASAQSVEIVVPTQRVGNEFKDGGRCPPYSNSARITSRITTGRGLMSISAAATPADRPR